MVSDRAWLKFLNLSIKVLTTNFIKPNANLLDTFIINSFKLNNRYIKLLILNDDGWISRNLFKQQQMRLLNILNLLYNSLGLRRIIISP